MKTASILAFIVCLACGAISRAAVSADIDVERQLVRTIASLSEVGDYESIYQLLGSTYRRRVPKEVFVRTSKEVAWILSKPRVGTIQSGNQTSYAPVRGSVKTRLRVYEVDEVLFFWKEENGWKIRNFPFLPEHMPNWPELPAWLE